MLLDAGDYNLFRYCHNDPIDFTDPMGLEDHREPWPNHQEQAKALDDNAYNFIMGLMQRQFNGAISAGMAGYQWSSVWSALQGRNLTMGQQVSSQAQGGVPARYAPHLDKTGHQIIHNYGNQKGYEWQLVDSNGKAFKGGDLINQEHVVSTSDPNTLVKKSGPTRLTTQGVLLDGVGPGKKLGPQDSYSRTTDVRNTLYWNGFPYEISTRFRQEVVVQQGNVLKVNSIPIEPPY